MWYYQSSIGQSMGKVTLTGDPADPNFIPYEDLTKDQVVGWLYVVLPVPDLEASLTRQLDAMINPSTETLPPPFPNYPSGSGSI